MHHSQAINQESRTNNQIISMHRFPIPGGRVILRSQKEEIKDSTPIFGFVGGCRQEFVGFSSRHGYARLSEASSHKRLMPGKDSAPMVLLCGRRSHARVFTHLPSFLREKLGRLHRLSFQQSIQRDGLARARRRRQAYCPLGLIGKKLPTIREGL